MIDVRKAIGPWTGAALGAAGMLGIQQVGPALIASGTTTVACCAVLLAAAAGVIVRQALLSHDRKLPVNQPAACVKPHAAEWAQCQKPAEWLVRIGAHAVPEEEARGFIRARLAATLRPLPKAPDGSWEVPLPESVALLALAFALRVSGRRNAGGFLISGLREAHDLPTVHARDAALSRLRLSIRERLDREGPLARAYTGVLARHGMLESLMLGLLAEARRRGGVLASGEFTWLKGVDRPLWYALNNLGRRGFHVEGLAAMAHYRGELVAGQAGAEPRVGAAVETLLETLRDEYAMDSVINPRKQEVWE
jgi:intracellular multiplication protein IcmP